MKQYAAALLMLGCSMAMAQTPPAATSAPAAPPGASAPATAPSAAPASSRGNFAAQKARQLERIGHHIAELNAEQSCVQAAQDVEALRACHPRRGHRPGPGGAGGPGGPGGPGGSASAGNPPATPGAQPAPAR